MATGFDLSQAIKERDNEVTPFPIQVDGYDDFVLSPLVTDSTVSMLGDGIDGFMRAQMSGDDYRRWVDFTEEHDLDQRVQGRLLYAYFEHIGYDNPFTEDGRLDRDAQGKSPGLNRSSRRSAGR